MVEILGGVHDEWVDGVGLWLVSVVFLSMWDDNAGSMVYVILAAMVDDAGLA